MAEVRINPDDPTAGDDAGDVEMQGGDDDVIEIGETAGAEAGGEGEQPEAAGEDDAAKPARVTFVESVYPNHGKHWKRSSEGKKP